MFSSEFLGASTWDPPVLIWVCGRDEAGALLYPVAFGHQLSYSS